MRCLLTLAFAAMAAAADAGYDTWTTGSKADVQTKTSPGLLLSGGGADVDEAFRWLIQKSGGGDIVILRASGSDGYNRYIPTLGSVHSVTTFVIKSREAAGDPDLIRRVAEAEAIFLAGGDQWNYVRMWKGTAIEDAINRAFRRGVPVGGSSAGLAVLGEYSFSARYDTVTSSQALADPCDKRVAIETDFLKLPPLRGVITDSHFSRRDRMGRLLVFLARLASDGKPEAKGAGIDEATAVLLEPGGAARVVGNGSAWFIRGAPAEAVCRPGVPLDNARYEVFRVAACRGAVDLRGWKIPGAAAWILTVEQGEVRRSGPTGGSIY